MPLTKRYLRRLAAAAAAAAMLVATACSNGDSGDGEMSADGEPDQVTYLTGFANFGREAYVYVALEKGYFEEVGIDVDIQPGGGTIPNIEQAVAGQADFVLGDFTGATLMYGNGQSQDFTVVSAIQQQTVFAIIALEGSGITSPQDLEGKKIGDAQGSFGSLLFPTYASIVGIDAEQVDYDDSFPPPQLPSLLATGGVDAIGQFVVGKPTIEAAADGTPAVVLPLSDVLADLYGISLVVSKEFAAQNPDLVQRFNTALMRGLEDAITNPQEAGEIMASYVPEMSAELVTAELELMGPYVQPPDAGAPLGTLDPQRVARSIAILEAAGAIPAGLTPEEIVSFDLVPQH